MGQLHSLKFLILRGMGRGGVGDKPISRWKYLSFQYPNLAIVDGVQCLYAVSGQLESCQDVCN